MNLNLIFLNIELFKAVGYDSNYISNIMNVNMFTGYMDHELKKMQIQADSERDFPTHTHDVEHIAEIVRPLPSSQTT